MANERIFISYKWVDKTQVFALIDKIERALGVKCWVDLDGIETSAQFASKICSAIDRAEVVLFMHSSAHLSIDYDNDWTVHELDYAHSLKKCVVLVKLDDAPLRNIFQMIYGSRNNIDSRNPDQWNNLLRDLRRWLNLPAPSADPYSPPRPQPVRDNLRELEDYLNRTDREVGHLRAFGSFDCCGFEDRNGNQVIPAKWKLFGPSFFMSVRQKDYQVFDEGLAAVGDSRDKWGFIDKKGNLIVPCNWDFVHVFKEGLAAVLDRNKGWGFINKLGRLVIPYGWKNAIEFSEGLALVQDATDKWGYIDKRGDLVLPCKRDDAQSFHSGRALVKEKEKLFGLIDGWHYIDKSGKRTK